MSVRAGDPDTSLDAWVACYPTMARERALVLRCIDTAGWHGITAEEIVTRLAVQGIHRQRNCVSSRCSQLKKAGLIVDRGRRRIGDTGRSQIVWHRKWS